MKYGIQLYSLREVAESEGAEGVLQMVSEAGYDGLEFAGFYGKTPEEMKKLLDKYGLRGISAHIGANDVKNNLPYIDALGIKYVFVPWVDESNFTDPQKYAAFIKALKEAKCLLDERGVVFGYHNHAYELENGHDYLKQLVDEVDGFKAELDVFWAHVAGVDEVEEMKKLRGSLKMVHIKEAAESDPCEMPEPVVGEGAVNMPGVFTEMKEQALEWAILEVEHYASGERECIMDYLVRSLKNMKKMGN